MARVDVLNRFKRIQDAECPGPTYRSQSKREVQACCFERPSRRSDEECFQAWELHQRSNLNIRRTGFCLVPDFIKTARMIRGQYLGKVNKILPYHVLVASLFEFHFTVTNKVEMKLCGVWSLFSCRPWSVINWGTRPKISRESGLNSDVNFKLVLRTTHLSQIRVQILWYCGEAIARFMI